MPRRVNVLIEEQRQQIDRAARVAQLADFAEDAREYAELFRGFVQATIRGKLDCKTMVQLSQQGDHQTDEALINETYQRHLQLFDTFLRNGLCRHFIQQMFFVYYYLMNRVGKIDKAEKVTEILKLQYDLFYYLNIVTQSLGVHLENAADSLSAQLEMLRMEHEGGGADA
ncbi:hypothetical protein SDC9_150523 [bioreactor metagenome]|uniref:Uncharacterized protein n=1 Tax=bioreactor metagenome TaxID=1076179 RepID=A0A645EPC6_9ZZZZ